MALIDPLSDHPQKITQVIHRMAERLEALERRGDHRAIFQRVYLLMTREMERRLNGGFFHDTAWMERVLVGFAGFYIGAMEAYDSGRECPPAWRLAFRQADAKRGFVLQDALLGINAHINNDLPFVLYRILEEDRAWPDARAMLRRRRDHDRINDVLADLVDLVQEELARHHARFIRVIDWAMGKKDESLSSFILTHCRTTVWYNTEQLLDAADEAQRAEVCRRIEQGAYQLAEKVAQLPALRITEGLAPLTRRWRLF